MRRKPCHTRECVAWLEANGRNFPDSTVCYLCGFEGPMCDWFAEKDERDQEREWLKEQS